MKTFSYKRKKQFLEDIEQCIGVKANTKYNFNIYHPIINGIAWMGIFHTHIFDVKEIFVNIPIKSSLNQLLLN